MGLDWMVENKPKEGCELQYNTLSQLLEQVDLQLEQIDENSNEYTELLSQHKNIKEQLDSVSITKFSSAKCPRVGTSKKAKEYFIANILPDIKNFHANKTEGEILSDFSDFYVVELSPYKKPQTKFSGLMTSGLDFRGKGIGCCELLDDNLRDEAYQDHNPIEAADYATRMRSCLIKYKKSALDENKKSDYEFVMAGIKWLEFWSEKGHGFHAWY